ncbi:MAG: glycosyltransferase [Fluviicola sp.]|nr:glycosyltransferase [Fluviicola sp.]
MKQKISIILPVKDTAKYLKTCVDSILAQTYENWELLAVDDASSDACYSILQNYAQKDERIKALQNPNPRLLNALRFGYAHSSGELIHRMDSDDVMPKDKLEMMVAGFENLNRHENLNQQTTNHNVLITGATEYFSDEGPIGDGFKRYDKWLMELAKKQSYREEVYKECVIPSNCWLVHRDDFDRIGAFSPDTFPEDYDLCFRFIAGGLKIIGLPKVLHHWRDRSDRISRNWEVYKDNRFFELKVHYFFKMDRDKSRPLVLWGAGKNGKDLAKLVLKENKDLHWVCDNEKKIGKDIYEVRMQHFSSLSELNSPQIIIAVASPEGQVEISRELARMNFEKGVDYWFFA